MKKTNVDTSAAIDGNTMLPAVVRWEEFYSNNKDNYFGNKSMWGDGMLNCRFENLMCRFSIEKVNYIDAYSAEPLSKLVRYYGQPCEVWIDEQRVEVDFANGR